MVAPTYAASLPYEAVVLDGLTAIYHRASGATHVVAEPVPQILATLGQDWLSAADLLNGLAAAHDVATGDAALAALTARIEELVALGLVTMR